AEVVEGAGAVHRYDCAAGELHAAEALAVVGGSVAVSAVGPVEVALVHGDLARVPELGQQGWAAVTTGSGGAIAGDGGEDPAREVDLADPVVPAVGEVERASVDGHPAGVVEGVEGERRGERGAAIAAEAAG